MFVAGGFQSPRYACHFCWWLTPRSNQSCPGVDSGVVAVIEMQADRIVANRVDAVFDVHLPFYPVAELPAPVRGPELAEANRLADIRRAG